MDIKREILIVKEQLTMFKWAIGVFASIVSIVVASIPFLYSLNINSYRNEFNELKKDLYSEIRKDIPGASVELLNPNGGDLNGSIINGNLHVDDSGNLNLVFDLFITNKGKGETGKYASKMYSMSPLELEQPTLNKKYKYERTVFAEHNEISTIPGRCTSFMSYSFSLTNWDIPIGQYKVMLEFYYGNGNIASSEFLIDIKDVPRKPQR